MSDLDVLHSHTNPLDPNWDYFSPSPTIPFLDHQEIVETLATTSPSCKESSSWEMSTDSNLECDGSQLFSFELDSNGSKMSFLNQLSDSPDFTWSDILSDSSSPVSLDEIFPTPLSNYQPDIQTSDHISDVTSLTTNTNREVPLSSNAHHVQIPTTLSSEPSFLSDLYDYEPKKTTGNIGIDYYDDDESNTSSEETVCELNAKRKRSRGPSQSVGRAFLHIEDIINGRPGQRINLTAEERQLLEQMDVRLPERFPLSRTEERALRAVRRKIRNKLSAQASRAKRQKYVLNLEEQLSVCNKENQRLRRQVADLQNDKKGLINHLNNLRSYLTKVLNKQNNQTTPLPLYTTPTKSETGYPNKTKKYFKTTAGGTSLLVITFMVLMWTSLVPIHQLALSARKTIVSRNPKSNLLSLFPGRSRVLLSNSWNPLYYFMNNPIESNLSSDPYLQTEFMHPESVPLSNHKSKVNSIDQELDYSTEASIDRLRKLKLDDANNSSDTESIELGAQPIRSHLFNTDILVTQ